MPLPPNVFPVYDRRGVPRYYHQIGRTKPKEQRSVLVRIPHGPSEAAFWAMAAKLNGERAPSDEGTFAAVIRAYKASPEWSALADATRRSYVRYLSFCEQAWGRERVEMLSSAAIVALRDKIAVDVSANTANQAMKAWGSFLKWCIPREHIARNVVADVPTLDHDAETTAPWPDNAWSYVVEHAPAPVSRMAILGRATGQRISDLVRLRPADRKDDGINMASRITKTRKRHWQALALADIATIDGWGVEKMRTYIQAQDGSALSTSRLRALLHEWLASSAGPSVRDIDLSPHGLRAMAFCDARVRGLSALDVAHLYCVSVAMVEHYTRHLDAELAGRAARARMDEAGTVVKHFPTGVKHTA